MFTGEFIRESRVRQQISQEMLAYGICSISNLSRIENGAQAPGRATYEALMERLGQAPGVFPSFANDRELEIYRLKHQIYQKLIAESYDEAEALLEKMESEPRLERVYEQLVKYFRVVLLEERDGGTPEDVLAAIREVVGMSVRDYEPKNILRQVLTKDEFDMLNFLAISYYETGDKERGIATLYALKEYIEKKETDDAAMSYMYTGILYNLARWTGMDGNHKESLRLCDIGIERCIEYGTYSSFADLLFRKGNALVMLGKKGEAKKSLQEAYYIHRARKRKKQCDKVKKFAGKHGIEL